MRAARAVVCALVFCAYSSPTQSHPTADASARWTWARDEAQLAMLINNARTQGFACPDAPSVTRSAFIIDDALRPGARAWVWELAHESFFDNGNYRDGRTLADRKVLGDFTGYLVSSGHINVQRAFDSWMASETLCPIVMSASATRASIAVALDTTNTGYIVVMK